MRQRYRTLTDYFEQTGDTRARLAQRLGVSRSYVSLITSSRRQPPLDLALRIQSLTGVRIESLLTEEVSA